MAIGTWEDFTDKYGFEDGSTCEDTDFRARSHIVEALNAHQEMLTAKVTAVEWDRPGMHNGCFILLFKNPDDLQAPELLKRWLDAPGHTGNDLEAPLPDNIEISEIISEAYAEAIEGWEQNDNAPTIPQLWLGIYHHRHGADYALWDHAPSEDEMLAHWKDDFEADRDDEYFESYDARPLEVVR